jgi:hypothetical protein
MFSASSPATANPLATATPPSTLLITSTHKVPRCNEAAVTGTAPGACTASRAADACPASCAPDAAAASGGTGTGTTSCGTLGSGGAESAGTGLPSHPGSCCGSQFLQTWSAR